jgi:hypothetical protein
MSPSLLRRAAALPAALPPSHTASAHGRLLERTVTDRGTGQVLQVHRHQGRHYVEDGRPAPAMP